MPRFTAMRAFRDEKELANPVATSLKGQTWRKFEEMRQANELRPSELLRQMVEFCLMDKEFNAPKAE